MRRTAVLTGAGGVLVCALLGAGSVLNAQPATRVRDIHPPAAFTLGSNPSSPTLFAGDLYFSVYEPYESPLRGVLRTDGTGQGTSAIFPELPVAMANFDGSLFFLGAALWRSDGSPSGTILVKAFDGCAGNGLPTPGPIVPSGSLLYFMAYAQDTGYELWKSDGTIDGTQIVKDLAPGPEGSNPIQLTPVNSKLVFFRTDVSHGGELWATDGSEVGTILLRPFAPNYGDPVVTTGSLAFFNGCNVTPGCGLHVTDGTPAGTVQLTDEFVSGLFPWGSIVLFFRGNELWRSDGTVPGTSKIADLPSPLGWDGFDVLGSTAYFVSIDTTTPPQLWKTDGTIGGTAAVTSIGEQGQLSAKLKTVDSTLFIGFPNATAPQIWKSDGTASGTVLVAELPYASPPVEDLGNFQAVHGRLFFTYTDDRHGLEPWVSDGTPEGTVLLVDVNQEPTSSDPASFGALDGMLLFAADDGVHYRGLWSSGGREANTHLVTPDLSNVGSVSGPTAFPFVQLGRVALFSASSPGDGFQLWRTDGTDPGTQLVKDVPVGVIAPLAGVAIFSGPGGIWRSDGTDPGTVQLVDGVGIWPPGFVNFEDSLFFLGSSSGHYGLWKTDGTPAGTVEVAPLNTILGNDYPYELVKSGNLLFFRATSPETGYELWKSDGTGPGTTMVTELVQGPGTAYIYRLTDSGGVLFFTAYDENGIQLWKSNGTAPGTQKLTSILGPWPHGPSPDSLRDVNGTLFFSMGDCEHGRELWKSDGTPEGTVLVKDIRPGPADSSPRILAVIGGEMLLTATDDAHGEELWKSDGTETGTVFFQDVAPGPASSAALYPAVLAVGNRLYFTADDSTTGTELWSLPASMLTGLAITPTSGTSSGGTTVAASGAYPPESSVDFGGAPGSDVQVPSPSYVTAVSPARTAGMLYDVTITQSGIPLLILPNAWFADFLDVDSQHPLHDFIESIVRAGITAGCGGGSYCPDASVTRAQMAVFLLKAEHGLAYAPPACQGLFADVPCPGPFTDWIEQLASEGITSGCGGGNYCPASPVTRAQMAIFLLKTLLGSSYVPPPAAGIFGDVPIGSFAADWIEDLYGRQITGGCSSSPLLYCPNNPNTRGQMAVFLTKTFSLP